MRICPIDWQESGFRAAAWTTAAARHQATSGNLTLTPALAAATQHYTFCPGCAHAGDFARTIPEKVFHVEQKAAIEEGWRQETERLFADYTATWTHTERDRHRAKLWPQRRVIEDWAMATAPAHHPERHVEAEADAEAERIERVDWPAVVPP